MYYQQAVINIIRYRKLATLPQPLPSDAFHSTYDRYEDHNTAICHHEHGWCTILTGERFDIPHTTPDYCDNEVPF